VISPWSAGEKVAGITTRQSQAQIGQSVALGAPDPLGGEVEQVAHLSLSTWLAPVEPVAQQEHPTLGFAQAPKDLIDLVAEHDLGGQFER
jgi:hypothetical protein